MGQNKSESFRTYHLSKLSSSHLRDVVQLPRDKYLQRPEDEDVNNLRAL